MKEKKNEGITLIALVITIIVLLILAGVTLSTLFGNNGILTESQLAVEANKEANAKEQVQLAWMGCETEYQAAWTQDSSVEKSNYFQKENLNKNLGTGTVKSVNYVENGKSTVTYTLDGTEYEFEITSGQVYKVGEAPDVTKETLVQSVTKDNYGDTINYSVDLDNNSSTNDWKIFYNDGNNVFIIASDYVPITQIPKLDTMTLYDTYNVKWNDLLTSNLGASKISPNVADTFRLNWLSVVDDFSKTSKASKVVEDLLNTENWNKFATGIEGAQAIASPTLEMWIDSWNEKYPNEQLVYNWGDNKNSDGSVYSGNIPLKGGYMVGNKLHTVNTEAYVTEYDTQNGYHDTLYFPHQDTYQSCTGYWLASPGSAYEENNLDGYIWSVRAYDHGCEEDFSENLSGGRLRVSWYEGNVSGCPGDYYHALRPVVCLPSDVNATKSGTTWTIQK